MYFLGFKLPKSNSRISSELNKSIKITVITNYCHLAVHKRMPKAGLKNSVPFFVNFIFSKTF